MNKLGKRISIVAAALFIAASSFFLSSYSDDDFEIAKNLDVFYTLFRELNIYYVDETDPGELIKEGIDKMLNSLDPYTTYFPESKMEDFRLMTTGQYGGIGALIRTSGKFVVITEPYEGFPAFKAGLKAGDIITEIDSRSVEGKSSSEISELLKGQPNTELKLTIQRPGQEELLEKTIVREEIQLKSVPYSGMLNDEIGYIRLSQFTEKASADVKAAFQELKEKNNVKALVFDLRGNPGGLLIEAVHIVNVFVNKGEDVVSTKGKLSQWNKTYKAMHAPMDTDIPVVLLVNSGSASASEIVAGAIQDLDRGVVIGQRTFGKGLVQTTRTLSYNARLKVTTAKYYIPSGRCIQALDYSHRNEDGSVGRIPDSLTSEFSTRNGRIVRDGGGILPDVDVKPEVPSKITIGLITKNLIFDYVTQYCITHDSVPAPMDISISDDEYKDFIAFLDDKEFDYETRSEETLNELKEIAKAEKYFDIAADEIAALQKKLAHDRNKDLEVFKEEIKQLIAEEISGRYYYQKGRMETLINKDSAVIEAIQILQDTARYNGILRPAESGKKK